MNVADRADAAWEVDFARSLKNMIESSANFALGVARAEVRLKSIAAILGVVTSPVKSYTIEWALDPRRSRPLSLRLTFASGRQVAFEAPKTLALREARR